VNPTLKIYTQKIKQNAITLKNMLSKHRVDIVAVTKVAHGDPKFAEIMNLAGIEWLGDSRIQNIVRMRRKGVDKRILQIRSPQISEIALSVKHADAALITELEIAKRIASQSKRADKKFGVIVMVELGDLREGLMPDEVVPFVREISNYYLDFLGIGTNLGCYGGVLPTIDKINVLLSLRDNLIDSGIDVPVVSGGATDTLSLIEEGRVTGINQLRIGEAIILGRDTTGNRNIPYLNKDTMLLEAEIIEIKEKASKPYGEIGRDSFGNIPVIDDLGTRKRAIIALGKQDVDLGHLVPLDPDVKILGGSSDHIILDIHESEIDYKVGSVVQFLPRYPSVLKLMGSPYVKRVYIP